MIENEFRRFAFEFRIWQFAASLAIARAFVDYPRVYVDHYADIVTEDLCINGED